MMRLSRSVWYICFFASSVFGWILDELFEHWSNLSSVDWPRVIFKAAFFGFAMAGNWILFREWLEDRREGIKADDHYHQLA